MKKKMTAAILTIAMASGVGFAATASADQSNGQYDCVSELNRDRRAGVGGFVRDLEPGGFSWGDLIQIVADRCRD